MTGPSIAVAGKAARYLLERRVQVSRASDEAFRALVQGSRPRPYQVIHTRARGWQCDCPAHGGCSHVEAVRLVFPEPSAARSALSAERIGAGR